MRILPSTYQSRLTVFGGAITQYPKEEEAGPSFRSSTPQTPYELFMNLLFEIYGF
jgi:hypothetical protein